jgi:hypothetical protein
MADLSESPMELIRYHVERLEEYSQVAPLTDLVWAYDQALDIERQDMTEPEVLRDTLALAIALRRRMDQIENKLLRRTS